MACYKYVVWFGVLSQLFFNVIFVDGVNLFEGKYEEGTVYVDPETGIASYKLGLMDKEHGTAYGFYNNTLNETGWGILEIRTQSHMHVVGPVENAQMMFAAGFLEGVLTAEQIWQNFINLRAGFVKNETLPKLKSFYVEQDAWVRSMIRHHTPSEDALWRHVAYIVAQFDGLYEGYKTVARPGWEKDVFVIQLLNGIGDYIDLRHVLSPSSRPDFHRMSSQQLRRYVQSNGHCSALVKVTAGYENMFLSHSSWFIYAATMRIFKHYSFNITDKDTAATSISFSSYAGYLVSLDDFYELSSQMVMLQTTNNVFNMSLYNLVTFKSLFAWQRVRIANMMAHTGQSWFETFRMYNSGTYNNQYMIIDLKRVHLTRSLDNGTLWVVEQIPGLVVGSDQTSLLRAGYWPSYNVPFYPIIYERSGYPEIVKQHGVEQSYQLAPRAKIFRRDQDNVVDMKSMQAIMRYNDYKHDKYSEGNACSSICCRGDLVESEPLANGCYDTKVASFQMALNMTSWIISGPTRSHNLPPFSWSGQFKQTSHVGLPQKYDFDWILTRPHL